MLLLLFINLFIYDGEGQEIWRSEGSQVLYFLRDILFLMPDFVLLLFHFGYYYYYYYLFINLFIYYGEGQEIWRSEGSQVLHFLRDILFVMPGLVLLLFYFRYYYYYYYYYYYLLINLFIYYGEGQEIWRGEGSQVLFFLRDIFF